MAEQPIDLLITNGTVLTMDPDTTRIGNGAVAVNGGEITSLGKADQYVQQRPADVIDARGGIIMPGLINTHTHLPMTIFRGFADDLPLDVWLNEHMFPAEAAYVSPGTVAPSSRLACAEMLLSGTTTCCDGYFYEGEVAEVAREVGLRGVLAQGVIDFPAPGVPDPARNIQVAAAYLEEWRDRSPLVSPSVFCHSPYTCSQETLRKAKELAGSVGCLFQIHVAETRHERERSLSEHRVTPIQYLDRLGILDDNALLVHSIWIDDQDIETIADRGARVSVTTESEMKLASGIAPVPRMLDAGIPVGLGTDGCASNNDLDLFQEMDFAAKLHKVNGLDPTVMDAETILGMATIGGARAIGLEGEVGSLEVGKQADIIVVGTDRPHLVPLYDEVSHAVYAVKGSDVRDVVVAGEVLVRNGELQTLDLPAVMEEAAAIGSQIRDGR